MKIGLTIKDIQNLIHYLWVAFEHFENHNCEFEMNEIKELIEKLNKIQI